MTGEPSPLETTPELLEALRGLASMRLDLFVEGLDYARFDGIVEAVRLVDAELVASRHRRRIKDVSPYFTEDFQAEEDGFEAAEKVLRDNVPRESDLTPLPVQHMGPPEGSGLMPCCRRTPFELSGGEQMTYDPAHVSCPGWKK